MAEDLGHDVEWYAFGEHHRCRGVPERVQPDAFEPRSPRGDGQGAECVPGVAGLADVGDEDVAAVFPQLRRLHPLEFGALADADEDVSGWRTSAPTLSAGR